MAFFICLVIVAVCIYLLISPKQKPKNIVTQTWTVTEEPVNNDEYDPEAKIIREEIKKAMADHSPAIKMLLALARSDGTTSKPERSLVFDFLNRNGAGMTYDRHRPYFLTSNSFMYSAVELDKFDKMIKPLALMPLQYRIDIFSTASAIVASGGTPKKREAEMLNRLKILIEQEPRDAA
jgi:uncharacterized tellurite resistance protein B-like protein